MPILPRRRLRLIKSGSMGGQANDSHDPARRLDIGSLAACGLRRGKRIVDPFSTTAVRGRVLYSQPRSKLALVKRCLSSIASAPVKQLRDERPRADERRQARDVVLTAGRLARAGSQGSWRRLANWSPCRVQSMSSDPRKSQRLQNERSKACLRLPRAGRAQLLAHGSLVGEEGRPSASVQCCDAREAEPFCSKWPDSANEASCLDPADEKSMRVAHNCMHCVHTTPADLARV